MSPPRDGETGSERLIQCHSASKQRHQDGKAVLSDTKAHLKWHHSASKDSFPEWVKLDLVTLRNSESTRKTLPRRGYSCGQMDSKGEETVPSFLPVPEKLPQR